MTNLGTISYSVDVETGKVLTGTTAVDKQLSKLDNSMAKADASAKSLTSGMSKLAGAIGAVIAASALRDMADLVQKYEEMADRVKMATSSQAEFEMVQKRLLATANGTYRSLGEAQELYIRTADSLRSMGYSTQQALDVTDSMSYAFVKNATSAQSADGAISALSKSINKGKVEADAWETVITAIPSVIGDIAMASGKTATEVRALGAAGKLTAKDLSEGLRKSLDANAKAAAGMSNNLTDASVRSKTALTAVLVSLENQTGGLQALTNGIIQASDAVLTFAGDSQKMSDFLDTATTAATALAAVIAAKLLGGLTQFAFSQAAAAVATQTQITASRAAAAANLVLAQSEQVAAIAALEKVKALQAASLGLTKGAADATTLAAAETRAAVATNGLNAALTASAGVASRTAGAMNVLKGAMAFLGGPVGVIMLAAAAMYYFAGAARDTKLPVDQLTSAIASLNNEQLALQQINLKDSIAGQQKAITEIGNQVSWAAKQYEKLSASGEATDKMTESYSKTVIINNAALRQANDDLATHQKRLDDVNDALSKRPKDYVPSTGGDSGTVDPVLTPTIDPDADKKLKKETDAIKDKIEALKLEAEVLGKTAREEELYRLAKSGATDAQIKAADISLSAIETYAKEKEALAALTSEEERRRSQFGKTSQDATKEITGTVPPLTGGMFDEQSARYEAEAAAEEQRYTDQLTRLQDAKSLQIEVIGGYQSLEESMAQQHADRMAQIEQAKNDIMMSSAADAFGQMSNDLVDFAAVFGSENSKMMAVAKAAAITQTIISTYQGAQQAFTAMSAIPIVGPALGVAAAGAAIAGGMARVASIRSQGGRAQGGPVQSDGMYRINETGAPEIFNAANGRQYMMPNSRGDVVSNKDATSGAGAASAAPVVNVHNYSGQEANVTSKFSEADRAYIIDVVVGDGMGDGKTGRMINSLTGTRRQGS